MSGVRVPLPAPHTGQKETGAVLQPLFVWCRFWILTEVMQFFQEPSPPRPLGAARQGARGGFWCGEGFPMQNVRTRIMLLVAAQPVFDPPLRMAICGMPRPERDAEEYPAEREDQISRRSRIHLRSGC